MCEPPAHAHALGTLFVRVLEVDLGHCPNRGGLKIITAMLEAAILECILTHPGLQARTSPRAPTRGQALQAV